MVEPQIVILVVAGSSPVGHPTLSILLIPVPVLLLVLLLLLVLVPVFLVLSPLVFAPLGLEVFLPDESARTAHQI